jgi:hypothetical protein
MKDGLAGKIAKGFIDSKLTVLLMIVFMIDHNKETNE